MIETLFYRIYSKLPLFKNYLRLKKNIKNLARKKFTIERPLC